MHFYQDQRSWRNRLLTVRHRKRQEVQEIDVCEQCKCRLIAPRATVEFVRDDSPHFWAGRRSCSSRVSFIMLLTRQKGRTVKPASQFPAQMIWSCLTCFPSIRVWFSTNMPRCLGNWNNTRGKIWMSKGRWQIVFVGSVYLRLASLGLQHRSVSQGHAPFSPFGKQHET